MLYYSKEYQIPPGQFQGEEGISFGQYLPNNFKDLLQSCYDYYLENVEREELSFEVITFATITFAKYLDLDARGFVFNESLDIYFKEQRIQLFNALYDRFSDNNNKYMSCIIYKRISVLLDLWAQGSARLNIKYVPLKYEAGLLYDAVESVGVDCT